MNIFWFRRDLRLADNPAFSSAVNNDEVLPIYILDNRDEYNIGGASKWWLHHSLKSLNEALNGKLLLFCGDAEKLIPQIATTYGAMRVYYNRCYEPSYIKTEKALKKALQKLDVISCSYNGLLLWEPHELLKKDGTPYKVFAPFLKLCLAKNPSQEVVLKPKKISLASVKTAGAITLDQLKLLPAIRWDKGIKAAWIPGEREAQKVLQIFVSKKLHRYEAGRNFPAQDVLSKLSPYLHYGELSPLAIWQAVQTASTNDKNVEKFISELCWREFACHLLFHFPSTATESYSKQLSRLKWHYNKPLLRKWQKGRTGYPIVDAGMRELWQTGYMHNRVRMITASFLIKNLLTDWRTGADWFMDCLVDADLAVNTMNWQWVAGTGLDAAPFFRIFNPVLQSEKYDADGTYIKQYVPELKQLPRKYLHKPWTAPQKVLQAAGVILGKTYPTPCIDLAVSNKEALAAYDETRWEMKVK